MPKMPKTDKFMEVLLDISLVLGVVCSLNILIKCMGE
jgi:hypothetical protein